MTAIGARGCPTSLKRTEVRIFSTIEKNSLMHYNEARGCPASLKCAEVRIFFYNRKKFSYAL